MKPRLRLSSLVFVLSLGALCFMSETALADGNPMQERFAALKESLAQSKKKLAAYEWIETTTILLDGEQKVQRKNRCYYGADGGVQKIAIDSGQSAQQTSGRRRRRGPGSRIANAIAANKKEELSSYMKATLKEIKHYVPPKPAKIQALKDKGKVGIKILDPGKRIRLDFNDYRKKGDVVQIELDLASNQISNVKVRSYLESPKDPIALDVNYGTLNDGTSYPKTSVVRAKEKDLVVRTKNSGYRKTR